MLQYTLHAYSYQMLRDAEPNDQLQELLNTKFILFAKDLRMLRIVETPLTDTDKKRLLDRFDELLDLHNTLFKERQTSSTGNEQ